MTEFNRIQPMNNLKAEKRSCAKIKHISRLPKTKALKKEPKPIKVKKKNYKELEFFKLSWNDFQAKPNEDSWFHAHSYWRVSYSYNVIFQEHRVIVNVHAKCIFEKDKSWVKPQLMCQELLDHEQGHYYIGCLCALTFKKRIKETLFSKNNYQSEINTIFQKTFQEFLAFEKKYDEETCHYINQEVQKRWDKDLLRKIHEFRSYWWLEN